MVTLAVVLNAGPLGLVTNPKQSAASAACARWLQGLLSGGCRVIIPEIADYEVRRELLRAGKNEGLARLNALATQIEYLALNTAAMRHRFGPWLVSMDTRLRLTLAWMAM
jgi:hypothetical protein